jgi:hypothetical protein
MTVKTTTLTVVAATVTLALAGFATPQTAQAHQAHHHHHRHFVVIGTPVGAAYAYSPAYYGGCYWTRQRVWDGWSWHLRRVQVCG